MHIIGYFRGKKTLILELSQIKKQLVEANARIEVISSDLTMARASQTRLAQSQEAWSALAKSVGLQVPDPVAIFLGDLIIYYLIHRR